MSTTEHPHVSNDSIIANAAGGVRGNDPSNVESSVDPGVLQERMIANKLASISNIAIGKTQSKQESTPTEPIELPKASGTFPLDDNVIAAFPDEVAEVISSIKFGESLWGLTARIQVRLVDGKHRNYFLKVVSLGETGRIMCEGEFHSLTAITTAYPGFCPKPYAWGQYAGGNGDTHFLLVEFRDIGIQPAEPLRLAAGLAELHIRSKSPTGKFGFHIQTCHARISQAVNMWDDSWCTVFKSHLGHIIDLATPILNWPEFEVVAHLTLTKVIPRLLLPLQENGRVLKPCLVHGDCWDGNTAMDARTGDAFIFDVCSFYGHNEYDTGNWRAPRHRLSNKAYIRNYKRHFPVSEPVEDWDARNLLYSLPYNIGNTIYVPGSSQRQVIYEDLTTLCKMFCPEDLKNEMDLRRGSVGSKTHGEGAEEEEEEEEEEED